MMVQAEVARAKHHEALGHMEAREQYYEEQLECQQRDAYFCAEMTSHYAQAATRLKSAAAQQQVGHRAYVAAEMEAREAFVAAREVAVWKICKERVIAQRISVARWQRSGQSSNSSCTSAIWRGATFN